MAPLSPEDCCRGLACLEHTDFTNENCRSGTPLSTPAPPPQAHYLALIHQRGSQAVHRPSTTHLRYPPVPSAAAEAPAGGPPKLGRYQMTDSFISGVIFSQSCLEVGETDLYSHRGRRECILCVCVHVCASSHVCVFVYRRSHWVANFQEPLQQKQALCVSCSHAPLSQDTHEHTHTQIIALFSFPLQVSSMPILVPPAVKMFLCDCHERNLLSGNKPEDANRRGVTDTHRCWLLPSRLPLLLSSASVPPTATWLRCAPPTGGRLLLLLFTTTLTEKLKTYENEGVRMTLCPHIKKKKQHPLSSPTRRLKDLGGREETDSRLSHPEYLQ
ncbi:hypothetical protein Q8A73_000589 [Channa argus]|nr:hypothetical protein Q8A73_000589 [Channa argus]